MMIRRQGLCVGILAGASLLLETSLTRLLAVSQYYHFAFLVVSLALLGYGASGTLLVLIRRSTKLGRLPVEKHLRFVSLGFVVSVGVAYASVNILPFDSYAIAWDQSQFLYLGLYYLVLSLPFMMSGYAVGIAIYDNQYNRHLIYGANLIGSGLGALTAPGVLLLAGVPGAVLLSGTLGLLAIIPLLNLPSEECELKGLKMGSVKIVILLGLFVFGVLSARNSVSKSVMGMSLSPYKGLAQALRHTDSENVFSRWNASSKVDVIKDAGTHNLPGLSYIYSGVIPDQLGLSVDAEALQPISLIQPQEFTASQFLPEAIAFKIFPNAKTLVVEPDGGLGVLQALSGDASEVVVLQENTLIEKAVNSSFPESNVFNQATVTMIPESNRVFMAQNKNAFDLIFYPLTESYRPVTSGAFSLTEEFDLTINGFRAVLETLSSDGIFVTTRWLQLPPSDSLRLAATLMETIDEQGLVDINEILVMFRGIQTMTFLLKPSGWDQTELGLVRAFCAEMKFDLVWLPDIIEEETNKFNLLQEPIYYNQIQNLFYSDDKSEVFDFYLYAISPPTDNLPFFYHFFKWEQMPDVLESIGHTMLPFGGSGYLVLILLLIIVGILSTTLILLPLLITSLRKESHESEMGCTYLWLVLGYFSLLGLAFLFIEIPIIQRSILIFGNPTYAFTIVICVILVFSGFGSSITGWKKFPPKTMMAALFLFSLVVAFLMPLLVEFSLRFSMTTRIIIVVVVLAPMAFLMGMPFPFGLNILHKSDKLIIPWVWAVNGSISVFASVLAAILILRFGFTWVQVSGGLLYGGAFLIYKSLEKYAMSVSRMDI